MFISEISWWSLNTLLLPAVMLELERKYHCDVLWHTLSHTVPEIRFAFCHCVTLHVDAHCIAANSPELLFTFIVFCVTMKLLGTCFAPAWATVQWIRFYFLLIFLPSLEFCHCFLAFTFTCSDSLLITTCRCNDCVFHTVSRNPGLTSVRESFGIDFNRAEIAP